MFNMTSSFPIPKHHKYGQVSSSEKYPVSYEDESDDDEEEDFIQKQVRLQRQHLQQQDEGLEMLSKQAARLGQLSLVISEEVAYQSRVLDDVEQDLENTQTHISYLNLKTKELIKYSGGKKNFLIILVMSLIVFILVLLVFYT